ncbi:MAG: hypothetical protein K2P04_10965, partial [Oscillospiraceae bacterium]|nr:hypothetical protein [Oscillospiraceae bacterium]
NDSIAFPNCNNKQGVGKKVTEDFLRRAANSVILHVFDCFARNHRRKRRQARGTHTAPEQGIDSLHSIRRLYFVETIHITGVFHKTLF